jgi:hypothetical protein
MMLVEISDLFSVILEFVNPSLATTNRWGNLTLVGNAYYKPLIIKRSDGTEYIGDNQGGPRVMKLRCDCGFEWEQEVAKFPGRRRMRNCMRPQCQFTKPAEKPKPIRSHGATYSMYLTDDVAAHLKAFAAETGLSFSKAANEIIRRHAVQKLLDD